MADKAAAQTARGTTPQITDEQRGKEGNSITTLQDPSAAKETVRFKSGVPKFEEAAAYADNVAVAGLVAPGLIGAVLTIPAAVLSAWGKVVGFVEWVADLKYRNNVAYGSGVAMALTLDALGINAWHAQLPEGYRLNAERNSKLPEKYQTTHSDQDFQQGVTDAVRGLELRAARQSLSPTDYYIACASAVVKAPLGYTVETFRAQMIKDWAQTERYLQQKRLIR